MTFTNQEAKELIHQHQSLLEQLDLIQKFPDRSLQEAITFLQNMLEKEAFLSRARKEIFVSKADDGYDLDLSSALQKIYIYYAGQPIAEKEMQLLTERANVESAIADLLPRTRSLTWLFAGKNKKSKADEAYRYLQQVWNSGYKQQIYQDLAQIQTLKQIPLPQVWQQFISTPEAFLAFAQRWFAQQINRNDVLPEFMELEKILTALDQNIQEFPQLQENSKVQIKNAVDRLVLKKLMETLSEIPVDELNRDKSGIRIKNLKENGFTTIADVYMATAYQLEAVSGISWEGAHLMKERSKTIADEAQKGIRIRLSVDDQNEEATHVISAIYAYRRQLAAIHEVNARQAEKAGEIAKARRDLSIYTNAFSWFFLKPDQKQLVITAYDELDTLLHGSYKREIEELFAQISTPEGDAGAAWQEFSTRSIEYFQILEEIVPGVLGNEDGVYGLPEELAREIQDECIFPDGLNCTLRRYQEWGVKYVLHQGNVLLGDEMGLGKTVQAIASMVSLKNTGATHFVVVCPASVLPNWCKEIAEKSKLRVLKVHGKTRSHAIADWMQNGGVAVTTFETTGYFQLPEEFHFSLLIVDEAHYVKNPEAGRTIFLKKLSTHADRKLFMTGTALENRVKEMISLIDILNPEVADKIRHIAFLSAAPQFREKIASVYYRRKREDVLTELPELIESKEWCGLSPKEEMMYEASLRAKNYAAIRQVSWNVSNDLKGSSKAERMLEIIREAEADGRKIIVFSFFLETIRKICALLGDRCMPSINGSVSPARRQQIIDDFEQAPAGTVLPAQIQSGGTGLNIQTASVVILCEPQFKPSIENQAISRAYRMGQARNVLVYRLLCEDTVDEKIMDMLAEKQLIFDAFADSSVSAEESFELDEKTFGDIIKEEIDRINEKVY